MILFKFGGICVAKEKFNLQDRFLNIVRTRKIEVKVYLVNGFQAKGIVRSFDNFTVLLENGKQQMLIYKHAISTIQPAQYIMLMKTEEQESEQQEQQEQQDSEDSQE
ncbi:MULTISPECIES: RNA chaperone Hfq [Fervidobacterium]|uniref:RNA-binding protein Hfq n=1 Tax=Fervidobacterium islandicum TaxID=2423 RepID=A0AAI8CNI5_FERIS|nr:MULTISPECIES: RNA chaperone Hfq [Fervidobacterium]AMW33659.1 RNA chaperone Hfq [Fervidobacterium islandicum]